MYEPVLSLQTEAEFSPYFSGSISFARPRMFSSAILAALRGELSETLSAVLLATNVGGEGARVRHTLAVSELVLESGETAPLPSGGCAKETVPSLLCLLIIHRLDLQHVLETCRENLLGLGIGMLRDRLVKSLDRSRKRLRLMHQNPPTGYG